MDNNYLIKELLKMLKPYRKKLLGIIACLVLTLGINLSIPMLTKVLMDQGFIRQNKNVLFLTIFAIFILYIINILLDFLKEKERLSIASKIRYQLTEKSFMHLMKLKAKYFDDINHAEILNSIDTDITNICKITDNAAFFSVAQILSVIGGVLGLCIIDFQLAIVVLMFIPIKYLTVRHFSKQTQRRTEIYIGHLKAYTKWLGNTVAGMKEVRIFDIGKSKKKEFTESQINVIEDIKKLGWLSNLNIEIDSILTQSLTTLIYIVGAMKVLNNKATVGDVFAFVTYSLYVIAPISNLLNIRTILSGILPSTKRFLEFINLPEEEDEGEVCVNAGDIIFQDVEFSYSDRTKVLDRISLCIPHGKKVAFWGANGSGKSTILNVLLRFYKPDNGEITFNGINIEKLDIVSYRKKMTFVSQQVYLFNATLRENICLDKNIDDKLLLKVLKICGLEQYDNKESLDYTVGENGSRLSGGQKQKVALARAIIQDREIVIFDEVTSNIDAYSEKQLKKILNNELKNKTVIFVTHQEEFLKCMDIVFVLKKGKLERQGA
ncbi:ABC transporter ATP-binding protein [Clostridium botulinum]|uniref:ABC transporter ATP-binding protein n=1 Tax=Clostridium botulinum TaxID=1491 RepID=UPI0024923BBB|nr:ABC transporter ATP-binding protein [Clostridium botulinum]BDB02997.1 multidrug ABC transporter ATP-binding protein [Clostridium botulinum]